MKRAYILITVLMASVGMLLSAGVTTANALPPQFAVTKASDSGSASSTNKDSSGSSNGQVYTDPALDSNGGCNQDSCSIIDNYINPFIKLLNVLVGLAITVGIIWGAIQISTSAGDPQKASSGKNHIRNAIIAAVAYVLLFGLLQFIIPGGIG